MVFIKGYLKFGLSAVVLLLYVGFVFLMFSPLLVSAESSKTMQITNDFIKNKVAVTNFATGLNVNIEPLISREITNHVHYINISNPTTENLPLKNFISFENSNIPVDTLAEYTLFELTNVSKQATECKNCKIQKQNCTIKQDYDYDKTGSRSTYMRNKTICYDNITEAVESCSLCGSVTKNYTAQEWVKIKFESNDKKSTGKNSEKINKVNYKKLIIKPGELRQFKLTYKTPINSWGEWFLGDDNSKDKIGPWWNASWLKSRDLTINVNANYRLGIGNDWVVVNVTPLGGSITSCSNEARVIDNSGAEVPFQSLAGDNSNWCQIGFFANLTANNTAFEFYYNNSGATVPDYSTPTFWADTYAGNGYNMTSPWNKVWNDTSAEADTQNLFTQLNKNGTWTQITTANGQGWFPYDVNNWGSQAEIVTAGTSAMVVNGSLLKVLTFNVTDAGVGVTNVTISMLKDAPYMKASAYISIGASKYRTYPGVNNWNAFAPDTTNVYDGFKINGSTFAYTFYNLTGDFEPIDDNNGAHGMGINTSSNSVFVGILGCNETNLLAPDKCSHWLSSQQGDHNNILLGDYDGATRWNASDYLFVDYFFMFNASADISTFNATLANILNPAVVTLGAEEDIGTDPLINISLTTTSPTNSTYPTTSVWVNGTTNFNGNITYNLDGAGNTSLINDTTSFSNLTTITAGAHNIIVYATNSSGVSDDKDTVYFTVNPNAPTILVDLAKNDSDVWLLEGIQFYSKWQDDVLLNNFIFSWNGTGADCNTWANDTTQNFNSGWANVTKSIPVACNNKVIGTKIYANDTGGNINVSTLDFTVNNPPFYTLMTQNNTNDTTINTNTLISAHWNDDDSLSHYIVFNGIDNETAVAFSGNWSNYTIIPASYTSGTTYEFKIYANDSDDEWNVTDNWQYMPDTLGPLPSADAQNVTNGTAYIYKAGYQFNITIEDDTSAVDVVILEFNGINQTVATNTSTEWYVAIPDLPAGNYRVKWYFNDTLNNFNSSEQYTYTVSKAVTVMPILYNNTAGNKVYNKGQQANITTDINTSYSVLINLTSNSTGWVDTGAIGLSLSNISNTSRWVLNPTGKNTTFNFTAWWTGDANYTAISNTTILYLEDSSAPTFSTPTCNITLVNRSEDNVKCWSYITDNDLLNVTRFFWNDTGSLAVNITQTVYANISYWQNASKVISESSEGKTVLLKFNATDATGNSAESTAVNLTILNQEPTYTSLSYGANALESEANYLNFSLNLQDNFNVSMAFVETNMTESGSPNTSLKNYSMITPRTNEGVYHYSIGPGSFASGNVFVWRVYFNDSINNWNTTTQQNVTIVAVGAGSSSGPSSGNTNGSVAFCGDKICSARLGENTASCYEDCWHNVELTLSGDKGITTTTGFATYGVITTPNYYDNQEIKKIDIKLFNPNPEDIISTLYIMPTKKSGWENVIIGSQQNLLSSNRDYYSYPYNSIPAGANITVSLYLNTSGIYGGGLDKQFKIIVSSRPAGINTTQNTTIEVNYCVGINECSKKLVNLPIFTTFTDKLEYWRNSVWFKFNKPIGSIEYLSKLDLYIFLSIVSTVVMPILIRWVYLTIKWAFKEDRKEYRYA